MVDERVGGGNDFQLQLIEPATERLLALRRRDRPRRGLRCGRLARRYAELGATWSPAT